MSFVICKVGWLGLQLHITYRLVLFFFEQKENFIEENQILPQTSKHPSMILGWYKSCRIHLFQKTLPPTDRAPKFGVGRFN